MGRTTCYIGLGGNIANEHGTPTEHLKNAIDAFRHSEHFRHVITSSLYASKAYGVTDQPDFVNAVLKADTSLAPLDLLDFCQTLENTAGRVRLRHWGERCLDVDILLYGNEIIQNDRLTVPHKELRLRNFVVVPLLEITPDLSIGGQPLQMVGANDWENLSYYYPIDDYIDYYNQRFLANIQKQSLNELTTLEKDNYHFGLKNYWDWIGVIDHAVEENLQKELSISKKFWQDDWYQNLLKSKKLEHRLKLAKKYKQENRSLTEIMLITALTVKQIDSIEV